MQLAGERLVARVSATRNWERLMAKSRGQSNSACTLRAGVSFIAICTMAASSPALAQTTSPTGEAVADSTSPSATPKKDEIIVTGIRQSLRSAQNQKRAADTVVD